MITIDIITIFSLNP